MGECKVISVINWKGGVGKTTLTHHLATGLIHLSEEERVKYLGSSDIPRVLMVDTAGKRLKAILDKEEKPLDADSRKMQETVAGRLAY